MKNHKTTFLLMHILLNSTYVVMAQQDTTLKEMPLKEYYKFKDNELPKIFEIVFPNIEFWGEKNMSNFPVNLEARIDKKKYRHSDFNILFEKAGNKSVSVEQKIECLLAFYYFDRIQLLKADKRKSDFKIIILSNEKQIIQNSDANYEVSIKIGDDEAIINYILYENGRFIRVFKNTHQQNKTIISFTDILKEQYFKEFLFSPEINQPEILNYVIPGAKLVWQTMPFAHNSRLVLSYNDDIWGLEGFNILFKESGNSTCSTERRIQCLIEILYFPYTKELKSQKKEPNLHFEIQNTGVQVTKGRNYNYLVHVQVLERNEETIYFLFKNERFEEAFFINEKGEITPLIVFYDIFKEKSEGIKYNYE